MKTDWTLCRLFEAACLDPPNAAADPAISGLTDDSRNVEPGNIFVALRGSHTDSHLFISDAVERGAAAVVVDTDIPAYGSAEIIRVEDSREALGRLAHTIYGNPTAEMLVFGVSGTNGKTTTTYLVESILRAGGRNPGVIGTIEYRYGGERLKAVNTTPSALHLARLMRRMRDAGVDAIAMEVSSHALDQRRVSGIEFDCALLTNITQDHLDYHGTMDAYAAAKRALYFDHLLRRKSPGKPPPVAVFNADDEWAARFASEFPGEKRTFGLSGGADVRAEGIRFTPDGVRFDMMLGAESVPVESPLLAMFNVQNILGAAAAAHATGFPAGQIAQGVRSLGIVSGRFERVAEGQDFLVIVDYSHTPDALERALHNAREMARGSVIAVFGCGGDRDNTKRPIMGRIAGDMADIAIVTNDNPRTEDPARIAAMVMDGVRQSKADPASVRQVLDRRAAIGEAIALARTGDLVLIAGKGHEDYQILGTETVHFDDREVAREFLAARAGDK